jgi:hypothetical protein
MQDAEPALVEEFLHRSWSAQAFGEVAFRSVLSGEESGSKRERTIYETNSSDD